MINLYYLKLEIFTKANAGWGIHPKEASKHHAQVASKILKECLFKLGVNIKEIDLISYSAVQA